MNLPTSIVQRTGVGLGGRQSLRATFSAGQSNTGAEPPSYRAMLALRRHLEERRCQTRLDTLQGARRSVFVVASKL